VLPDAFSTMLVVPVTKLLACRCPHTTTNTRATSLTITPCCLHAGMVRQPGPPTPDLLDLCRLCAATHVRCVYFQTSFQVTRHGCAMGDGVLMRER
jgi:hypothetical protein